MSSRMPPVALLGRALPVCALLACALMASALVPTAHAQARGATSGAPTCAETMLDGPTRLSAALRTAISTAAVRAENGLTAVEVAHLAEDSSSWVDECGQVFVVDRAAPASQLGVTEPVPEQGPPADVFDLSSRPSSDRTIYLDFDGATYSGTRWQNGAEIVSPAYSVDADRTTFTEVERAQIHLAWLVVAEDFAPFDVNVTTRVPAASALTRTSAADPTYGTPVVITSTNSVGTGCSCGGVAYLDVFDVVGTTEYAPAWIFTNGSGVNGYNVGQVTSHEIGHTFGLEHDGTSQSSYYSGAKGWAPIMGSSYNRRASQWSSGEYADANNTQDDVAIIATTAPTLADDHTAGIAGATVVTPGTTTTGTITSRADADAFTFTASGETTLAVTGPAAVGDLDVQMTVVDALGATVATVNPTADTATDDSLGATWSATLPSTTASTYIAVVDGAGYGNPTEAGRYSDFGSLGTYTVSLTTQSSTAPVPPPTTTPTPIPTPSPTPSPTSTPSPTATSSTPTAATYVAPMSFVTTSLPKARAGTRYRAVLAFTGPVSKARVTRLPKGLTWRMRGDTIVIRGKVVKPMVNRLAAVLSGDGPSVRRTFRLVVR